MTTAFILFCPTSKMSHDHGRRGSCSLRFKIRLLHLVLLSLAGAVTDVGVGSGALLAPFLDPAISRQLLEECAIKSMHVIEQRRGPLLPLPHVTNEEWQKVLDVQHLSNSE